MEEQNSEHLEVDKGFDEQQEEEMLDPTLPVELCVDPVELGVDPVTRSTGDTPSTPATPVTINIPSETEYRQLMEQSDQGIRSFKFYNIIRKRFMQ